MQPVHVIGGGMAGVEITWQLIRQGIPVRLYEMRPQVKTPVHEGEGLAQMVCSNSLKSTRLGNASQVLKLEMRKLDSLILAMADTVRVPAGQALAVDRQRLSQRVSEVLEQHPLCHIERSEVTNLNDLPQDDEKVVATGPMTSPSLMSFLEEKCGQERLYFYDCLAPIIFSDSIDRTKVFQADRYNRNETDSSEEASYLNCPLEKEAYLALIEAIGVADRLVEKPYEKMELFESCLPIEEMVRRGVKTLSFGPMKPVGLEDPQTGRRPYAVIQLRQEDQHGHLYSLVGCQTRMKIPDQENIFRQIPGLEQVEFARYGAMHRNAYIHSPSLLDEDLSLRSDSSVFFAGQITGVEGYMESAATGLWVGWCLARRRVARSFSRLPASSAIRALIRHITQGTGKRFEPMNINWGLMMPPIAPQGRGKKVPREVVYEKSLRDFDQWLENSAA
jgi:methylenetetrahydrofolate--tRNA-(uracil-5-)-methyltransferase